MVLRWTTKNPAQWEPGGARPSWSGVLAIYAARTPSCKLALCDFMDPESRHNSQNQQSDYNCLPSLACGRQHLQICLQIRALIKTSRNLEVTRQINLTNQ